MAIPDPDPTTPSVDSAPLAMGVVDVACPHCGNAPRLGARFCDVCGMPLSTGPLTGLSADVAALQRVTHALVTSLELEPMLREVARASLGVAGAECCTIERWLPGSDELEVLAEEALPDWPEGAVAPGTVYALADSPSFRPVLAGQVARYAGDDPRLSPKERAEFADWGVGSALYVPIMVRGACVGVMELFSRTPDAFPSDRVATCAELAAYAGLGFERAEAFQRERKLADRLGTVADAATRAARELDPDRLVDEIPRLLIAAFGHYLVNVFLVDPADGALVLRGTAGYQLDVPIGARMPAGAGICGQAAATGEVYLSPDVLLDPHYMRGPGLFGTRSELAAPIQVRGRILGVLDVQSREPQAFDAADATALRALAAALGVAIENARLFRRVQEDEHRLRAIIEAVPSPLAVFDANWRVLLLNQAMDALYAWGHAVTGVPIAEVSDELAPLLHDLPTAPANSGAAAPPSPPEDELRLADPPRTFIRRVQPVAADGEAIAHVVLYQDVTPERAALRAKDQLLSIAAHELRTPLTAMLGFVDLLRGQLEQTSPDVEAARRRAVTVQREARRLAELVEELLNLAQLETGSAPLRLTELDLGTLIRDVAERFTTVPGAGQRLRLSLPPAPVMVRWDGGRVDQVLTNLVDNALKYAPAPTPVEVVVEPPSDGEIRVEVRDAGPGLAAEELDGLFRPFARGGAAERAGDGLGLGLHVSRLIAERHGGRLWLESAPGRGTAAVLVMPVTAEAEG